ASRPRNARGKGPDPLARRVRPDFSPRLRRLGAALAELEPVRRRLDADRVAGPEIAAQDPLRERVLELLLDRPLQRPRAVDRVVARLGEPVERRLVELEPDIALA